MKHYFHPMSRGASTAWMFRELDVEHDEVIVDVHAGEQNAPEYRAINPMGKVPTLVDGNVIVTETAAICAYLADRFPERAMAPEPGSRERGAYYRYLFVPGTTLEPVFSLAALSFEHPVASSAGWGDTTRALATIESMVPAAGWALGDRFSAADVVFGGTVDFCVNLFGVETSPRVAGYLDRLRSRPAYLATHSGFGTA